ncbi:MAG: hypothetical protein AVDCRST_MAG85-3338, partial [uncultured Solirubrobacteraceae bacterium]
ARGRRSAGARALVPAPGQGGDRAAARRGGPGAGDELH